MADRPIMDPTKAPAGAITFVYQDYAFLQRWVDYYGGQFGREHLYVFSHGGDPEHDRIAEGCTVSTVPRDPTLRRLDRIRWGFLTDVTNGLLRYYNWLFVGDVDEVVLLDPAIGTSLTDYLQRYEKDPSAQKQPAIPKSLSPFGIELIHNPAVEPDPIDPVCLIRGIRQLMASPSLILGRRSRRGNGPPSSLTYKPEQ
jgi:hypothetical protein